MNINKAMENEETGIVAPFHVLSSYYVHPKSKYVQARFQMFASEKAYKEGKDPIGRDIVVEFYADVPKNVGVEQFIYESVVSDKSTPYYGAEIVKG